MNRKIAIIGTVGIPSKYGGFETLTEYLVEYLNEKFDLTVFCSGKSYTTKLKSYKGAQLEYINLKANGIQSIPYDIISIFKSLKRADTLLILGVSGCIFLPFLRIFSKKRIVVNIDGLEWKREKWNKFAKWFLKFSERLAVKYASDIVADNKVIQEYVEKEYNASSHLIAYGGDHVLNVPITREIIKEHPFLKTPYAFKVCRIEPENKIHIILKAFKEYKKLNLVIVGNWNANEYGKALKKKYSNEESIFLLDPIYDQVKLNGIRGNCKLYIHGHSAGGTNPSLVEAMYLKLPILAYGVLYNKESTFYKAEYFDNQEELVETLSTITDFRINEISESVYEIAKKNYCWEGVTYKYAELF
ncbi:DUF1972 domain-containing protein [uncultured Croceitalea sp.]|uniref:DUF1972 domain-containing protein n=1 Tax=uncultured Croceitalea sp. TaxID=1798908 RepID=UPI003306320B